MVISTATPNRSGFLITDALVALALLAIAVIPLAYGFRGEGTLLRATYQRAVACEIVDGEAEIMAAGAGRSVSEGTSSFSPRADAAANLPPGRFAISRHGNRLRVEWTPEPHSGTGPVSREIVVK